MTLYLDTSLLVAALTNEVKTAEAQKWLSQQQQSDLYISDWVVTEFSAAMAKKVRTGAITGSLQAGILAGFRELIVDRVNVLPCGGASFRTAARFADRHDLALRAGDALHLAISVEHDAALCTLDRRLAEAGSALLADIVFF